MSPDAERRATSPALSIGVRRSSWALVLVPWLLPACVSGEGAGPSIDSTCTSLVDPGDPAAGQDALQALHRLNCYRSAMGLSSVRLDAELSAAARAHAEYIDQSGDFGHVESQPGLPAFSGVSPGARLLAAGYPLDEDSERITEVLAFQEPEADPEGAVDTWMDTVYHREPLASPALLGVGFGSAGIYSVMELVSPWEAADAGGRPLVALYPVPDQAGVPTSFDSDTEWPDPAPEGGVVGYPVTTTVIALNWHGDANPHALRLDATRSRLDGPWGQVPTALLSPDTDPFLTRSAGLLPTAPLQPETDYEVQLVGTLDGASFQRFWSFRTGEE